MDAVPGHARRRPELVSEAERQGRPAAPTIAVYLYLHVAEDGDRARRALGVELSAAYGRDLREPAARYSLAGTPADCIERLHERAAAGATAAIATPLAAGESADAVVRLFGTECLGPLGREPGDR